MEPRVKATNIAQIKAINEKIYISAPPASHPSHPFWPSTPPGPWIAMKYVHAAKQANQMHKNFGDFRPTNIAIKPGMPAKEKSRHTMRNKPFLKNSEHLLISDS